MSLETELDPAQTAAIAGDHVAAGDVVQAQANADGGEHAEGQQAEAAAFTFDGEDATGDDDALPEDAPNWAKSLRERNRELARDARAREQENRELKAQIAPKPVELGPKPTLETCGYDEEQFEQELTAWHGKKTDADRKAEATQADVRQKQEAWTSRVTNFEKKAAELVPNFDEVALSVADHFGNDEAGNVAKAILIYADDPRLIAALNSSPAKLAELVALKSDPTALAIAVGELKGKIRTMPRRQAPPPEAISKGGAPVAASVDKELARLEKDAERTRDRSEVIAYKRKLREAAA